MTLLIKNGLVYCDGETEPRKTDIFVRGSKIVRLGNFSRGAADRVLDAQGAVVLPGLVEIGSDFDHYFGPFSAEIQEKFVRRGITTVIGGNFGISLAPFQRSLFGFFYRPKDFTEGNVDWDSVKSFLKAVNRQKKLLNFGTMLGYENAKSYFTNGRTGDLTDREVFSFVRFVAKSLREGAYGVSFDFEFPFSNGAQYRELKMICIEIARIRGVFAVHFARDGEICRQAEMILKIARETGVNLEISNLESLYDVGENECEKLGALLDAHTAHVNAGFDFTPFQSSAFPVFYFLPPRLSSMSFEETVQVLDSGHADKELIEVFKKIKPEKVTIGYVPGHLAFLRGKTLKDFAVVREIPLQKVMLEFLKVTKLRAVVSYKSGAGVDLRGFLHKPNAIISSGNFLAAGLDTKNDFNVKTLRKIADKHGVSFLNVLARMTELPAQKFGVNGRGEIREGCYADLLVLRGDDLDQVVVNGQVILDGDRFTGKLSGKVLAH